MPAALPTVADATAELAAVGITLTAEQAAALTPRLAAALAEFQRTTNRIPLLAPAGDVTRQLDPPIGADGVLHLDRDLATLTSVAYQPQGGFSTTLTATQYLAEPVNAPADGRPYERLVLTYRNWMAPLYYPQRGSIYVTGRWGYATTVPDDVWYALIARAAGLLFSQSRYGTTGGVESWKDADRELKYGTASADLLAGWKDAWMMALANYKRVTI